MLAIAAGILLATSSSFAVFAIGLRFANDSRTRRWNRLNGRWEPAMLEVLGGAAEPEAVFDRVDDKDGVHFLTFLLRYARLLRGDEQEMLSAVAAPYLPLVLPRVRRGSSESRGNAVLMLARMGMPEYADVVAEALNDKSPIVSMIAARSLFRPGHEKYFPAVLEHLPRFTAWSRSFLAGMLAAGGWQAAPLLREIMRDKSEPPLVRAVACDALRELNDLDAVPLAVELLADETDRELVAGSLRIIKQLGHSEHVPVARALVSAEDPVIRATAVAALGSLGGAAEIPLLHDKLDDPSFWVSLEAARGLLALGERDALETIAESDGQWSTLASQVLSE